MVLIQRRLKETQNQTIQNVTPKLCILLDVMCKPSADLQVHNAYSKKTKDQLIWPSISSAVSEDLVTQKQDDHRSGTGGSTEEYVKYTGTHSRNGQLQVQVADGSYQTPSPQQAS
jgi:hypothetical protein